MDESEMPDFIDMNGPGLAGGMEGNSGNQGYSSDVSGIISVAGALGDSDWIDETDEIPAMIFHGDADQTVTIDSAMFVLYGLLEVTIIEGSNYIHQKMDEVGLTHCYHITPGGNHVAYLGNAQEYLLTLNYSSHFMADIICNKAISCSPISTALSESAKSIQYPFPNPCNDILRLTDDYSQGGTIHDMHGRVIEQTPMGKQSISLSHLSEGMYYLKTKLSSETVGFPLIIQHD
jgi:hypothetical protein